MKKFMILFLAGVIGAALIGCGSGDQGTTSGDTAGGGSENIMPNSKPKAPKTPPATTAGDKAPATAGTGAPATAGATAGEKAPATAGATAGAAAPATAGATAGAAAPATAGAGAPATAGAAAPKTGG